LIHFGQFLVVWMRQDEISNFSLNTINKGALLWISSSFKFLCVWTLAFLLMH
jgi:hypothetical protein